MWLCAYMDQEMEGHFIIATPKKNDGKYDEINPTRKKGGGQTTTIIALFCWCFFHFLSVLVEQKVHVFEAGKICGEWIKKVLIKLLFN